jgi:fused signal recognition particle receptor
MALNWLKKKKGQSDNGKPDEPQRLESEAATDVHLDAANEDDGLRPSEPSNEPEAVDTEPEASGGSSSRSGGSSSRSGGSSSRSGGSSSRSGGYFSRLKSRLSKTRRNLADGLDRIFIGGRSIDDGVLEELEELLITADIGVQTALELIERISSAKVTDAEQLKQRLCDEILEMRSSEPRLRLRRCHHPVPALSWSSV